jgi:hypothetical protein
MVVLRSHVGLSSMRCESHQISVTRRSYTTSLSMVWPSGSPGGTRRTSAREPTQSVEQWFRDSLCSIMANSREVTRDRRNDGQQAPYSSPRSAVLASFSVAGGVLADVLPRCMDLVPAVDRDACHIVVRVLIKKRANEATRLVIVRSSKARSRKLFNVSFIAPTSVHARIPRVFRALRSLGGGNPA